nr:hypothetical protein [Tanacetum cinerariifolium]
NSQTTPETQSLVIPNDVEEDNHDIEVVHMVMIRTLVELSDVKLAAKLHAEELERVSAGIEIPSVVEEHVNTASADITEIRDSTAAVESVNAADES